MPAIPAEPTPFKHRAGRTGRPLRFLATVLLLWSGGRMIASMGANIEDGRERPIRMASLSGGIFNAAARGLTTRGRIDRTHITDLGSAVPAQRLDRIPIIRTVQPGRDEAKTRMAVLTAPIPASPPPARQVATVMPAAIASSMSVPVVPLSAPGQPERWSGSAWILWRDEGPRSALGSAGQLGGGQAGLRIERRLDKRVMSMPVSAYARLTAALRRPAAPEAAAGIAFHPASGRIPVIIGIERRVALDGDGRNAFSLLGATGLNPTRIVSGLVAEGYVQTGVVGFSRGDLFADGRFTLTMPLDRNGTTGAGFGVSGGAQPGASRLDIGPLLQTRLPIGSAKPRLSFEWRHRVAGNARPGSGATITLASDF